MYSSGLRCHLSDCQQRLNTEETAANIEFPSGKDKKTTTSSFQKLQSPYKWYLSAPRSLGMMVMTVLEIPELLGPPRSASVV
jgi:hypothetical protein